MFNYTVGSILKDLQKKVDQLEELIVVRTEHIKVREAKIADMNTATAVDKREITLANHSKEKLSAILIPGE